MNHPKLKTADAAASQIFTLYTEEQWKNDKQLFNENISNFFSAKKNEVFIIADEHSNNFLIGLGKSDAAPNEIQKTAEKFTYNYRKNFLAKSTELKAENLSGGQIFSFVQGLFLGTYEYPFRAKHVFWQDGFALLNPIFSGENENGFSTKIYALCKGQFAAMDWLNKPANQKKTPEISAFFKSLSEEYHFKYTAFNREESAKLGLGAFVSVNLGSAEDCAFTILEYSCGNPDAKTIGLVGKCVLFDTGGISLKNPEKMHYMKSDMGGATAVFGTLIAAAEQKLQANIVAVLPATDNAISAAATIPSDVVKAYNGKTIEILNTDAEGRMTLADGLSYLAKNYKTDVLIDLATLTGSAVRMFGYTCGAMFSNNQNLKSGLEKAGDKTGQRLWNLPLWDVWQEEITSDVADFKNISLKPFGDCIVAAKFLEQFVEGHHNWAHLDIAGVAFGNTLYAKEKAATGYGVQLLLDFIENF